MKLTPEIIKYYAEIYDDPAAEFWGLSSVLDSIMKDCIDWQHPTDPTKKGWIAFVNEYMISMELLNSGMLEIDQDSE